MSLFYELYITAEDESVCGNCRPHHGMIYRTDMGPNGPQHPQCRCARIFIDVEVETWRETRERMLKWHAEREEARRRERTESS